MDSAIQRLNNRGLKNKKLFSVYDDNIFPFIREFNVFSREELQDYLKFWTVTKNVTYDETRQQSWSWPGWKGNPTCELNLLVNQS